MNEKIRTVVSSESEVAGLRENIKLHLEASQKIEVIGFSTTEIAAIRQQIVRKKPDFLLVDHPLFHSENLPELIGFIRKVKKHTPNTEIIIRGPKLVDDETKRLLEAGVFAYINEQVSNELLGPAIETILQKGSIANPMVTIAPREVDWL